MYSMLSLTDDDDDDDDDDNDDDVFINDCDNGSFLLYGRVTTYYTEGVFTSS